MIDIFAPEITALDAELLHLQSLLESKRKEQSMLKELGFEANSTISAIVKLKEKVAAVKSDAIASLKSAVLNLFGDDGADDGGNQPTDPTPDPEPTNPAGDVPSIPLRDLHNFLRPATEVEIIEADDDDFDILALNGETGECLTTDDLQEEEESQEEQEDIEDSGEDAIIYHPDNAAIAWIANPENEKFTVFIGFARKAGAKSWQRFIEPMATVELGEAEILEGFKWELYCYGLSMAQLTKLTECDFTKKHHAEIGTTTPPQSMYRFQPPAIQIGSKVTKLNSEEIFEATSELANKIFFAKSTVTGERKLFSIEDVHILSEPLPKGSPQYATVLLAECPWKGEKLQIVAEGEGGYTLRTEKGNYWYRRDCVELFDEAIEAIADSTEPESTPVLGIGDIVEILSDRYPQYLNQVGTVEEILKGNPDTPIQVRCPRGAKLYHRSEVKLISKGFEATKELVGAGAELDF